MPESFEVTEWEFDILWIWLEAPEAAVLQSLFETLKVSSVMSHRQRFVSCPTEPNLVGKNVCHCKSSLLMLITEDAKDRVQVWRGPSPSHYGALSKAPPGGEVLYDCGPLGWDLPDVKRDPPVAGNFFLTNVERRASSGAGGHFPSDTWRRWSLSLASRSISVFRGDRLFVGSGEVKPVWQLTVRNIVPENDYASYR